MKNGELVCLVEQDGLEMDENILDSFIPMQLVLGSLIILQLS